MTSSIPNGFSAEELQRMLDAARPEPEVETDSDDETLVSKMAWEIAMEVQEIADKMSTDNDVPPQLVGKVLMAQTISRMIEWHDSIGKKCQEEDMPEMAMGWHRDSGKFQAMMNILATISVCDGDELVNE